MKKIAILLILLFFVSGCVLTPGTVGRISSDVQEKYDSVQDYSATVTNTNYLSGKTTRFMVLVKKPDLTKYIYEDGTVSIYESSDVNIDFYKAFTGLLERDVKVKAEEATLNNKAVFKVTFELEDKTEVYYIDTVTALPIRIEYYMGADECKEVNDFLDENNIQAAPQVANCLTMVEEITDLQVNTGLTAADFQVRPGESKSAGNCNPRFESAKPIEKASFTALLPTSLPQGLKLVPYYKIYSKGPVEGGFVICPDAEGVRAYTSSLFGTDFEVVAIETTIGTLIMESDSPLLFWGKTKSVAPPQRTTINGQPAEIVTFSGGEKSIFWEQNNLYIAAFYEGQYSSVMSKSEAIQMAESLTPVAQLSEAEKAALFIEAGDLQQAFAEPETIRCEDVGGFICDPDECLYNVIELERVAIGTQLTEDLGGQVCCKGPCGEEPSGFVEPA